MSLLILYLSATQAGGKSPTVAIAMDGVVLGLVTVTASHASGATQAATFQNSWTLGAYHVLTLTPTLLAGASLWIEGATFNGLPMPVNAQQITAPFSLRFLALPGVSQSALLV